MASPHWLLEFLQVVHENGGGVSKNVGTVTKWDPIFESQLERSQPSPF